MSFRNSAYDGTRGQVHDDLYRIRTAYESPIVPSRGYGQSCGDHRDRLQSGRQAMSDVSVLLERIDAEFSALEGKIKRAQDERLQEHQDRQHRLATFKMELDSLPEVWRPRLEALIQRFGDYAKV